MSKCLTYAPEYGDVNFLVDRLPLQEKFVMNNTSGIEKETIIIVFVVDGCCLTFFGGGVPVGRHLALCLLV